MAGISKNRQHYVKALEVDEVVDLNTFAEYALRRGGVPRPKASEFSAIQKVVDGFFEQFPSASYSALTDLVRWMKTKPKHYTLKELVGCWQLAHSDGFMKILERGSTNDDTTLAKLLAGVEDEVVRRKLMLAASATERDEIYRLYLEQTDIPQPKDVHPTLNSFELFVGQVVQCRLSPVDNIDYGIVLGEENGRVIVQFRGKPTHLEAKLLKVRCAESWIYYDDYQKIMKEVEEDDEKN